MTRDEIIRWAREAGLDADWIEDSDGEMTALRRFATLAIGDFLASSGQYVTNDASREAVIDAARLEGWRAAREQAARQCMALNVYPAEDTRRRCFQAIRAMQPPAEWQCAEVKPVCGADPSITPDSDMPVSWCKTCGRANVSCQVYPLYTLKCVEYVAAWPHEDGFAGGLTERTCDGQGQEG